MGAVFLMIGIILMFFVVKYEREAVKIFMKGVSDFAEFCVISGISRGVNITLVK